MIFTVACLLCQEISEKSEFLYKTYIILKFLDSVDKSKFVDVENSLEIIYERNPFKLWNSKYLAKFNFESTTSVYHDDHQTPYWLSGRSALGWVRPTLRQSYIDEI